MKLNQIFMHFFRHELIIAHRTSADWLNPLLFFVIVVSLFPLAISSDMKLLHTIAPGLIWVAVLLAILISFNTLFRNDFEDGSLELLLLTPYPLPILVLAKIFAHWFKIAIPLIILTPLLGLFFSLSINEIKILVITLLLGTPSLMLIGAISVALTISLQNNGILLALLILPLCIPVLIFGAGSVLDINLGQSVRGQLAILTALLIFSLSLAPWAIAAALRVGIE